MGVDDYADRARDSIDEQSGSEGLDDIEGGEDDTGEKARDAMDAMGGQSDEDDEEYDR